jgi:probable HAF family extracellular repeat protein
LTRIAATLWRGGKATDISGKYGGMAVFGINNAASPLIVGSLPVKVAGSNLSQAMVWQNSQVTTLGALNGRSSEAHGVNLSGQIVGVSNYDAAGNSHAALWQNGTIVDLGGLFGSRSVANAINDAGQIVGSSDANAVNPATGGLYTHAVLWQKNPASGAYTVTDLGTLGQYTSFAYAINNQGQIVGSSYDASRESHAFLWQNGTLLDLNTLVPADSGWVLQSAQGINDSGQIVGWGYHNGATRTFILTPL